MADPINPQNGSNPSDPAASGAPADPVTEERDVSGAAALFGSLLAGLAQHAAAPEVAAYFRGMISDEEARRDGISVSSDRVLSAAMADFAAVIPHVIEEPLPGYGRMRAHYALSLALDHARAYASFLEIETKRAATSESKSGSLVEAREMRTWLQGLLGDAAQGDDALLESLAKAARRGARTPAQVSASLQGLTGVGRELLARAANQPGMMVALADMGITEETIARAEATARSLGAARTAHDTQRSAHREESDELNTFDGRVWFELEALQRAADRARAAGRKVPAVRLEALTRPPRKRAAPAAASAPAPAAASAPAPAAAPAGR